MADTSDAFATNILNYGFRTDQAAPTRPPDCFVRLWTVVPLSDGTGGTEVTVNAGTTGYTGGVSIGDAARLTAPQDDGDYWESHTNAVVAFPAVVTTGYAIAGFTLGTTGTGAQTLTTVTEFDTPVDVGVGEFAQFLTGDLEIRILTAT